MPRVWWLVSDKYPGGAVINITTECLMCNNRHAERINILCPYIHNSSRSAQPTFSADLKLEFRIGVYPSVLCQCKNICCLQEVIINIYNLFFLSAKFLFVVKVLSQLGLSGIFYFIVHIKKKSCK